MARSKIETENRMVTPIAEPKAGYVLTEDEELQIRTLNKAVATVGRLIEGESLDQPGPELNAEELAAVFHTFARAGDLILDQARFERFRPVAERSNTPSNCA